MPESTVLLPFQPRVDVDRPVGGGDRLSGHAAGAGPRVGFLAAVPRHPVLRTTAANSAAVTPYTFAIRGSGLLKILEAHSEYPRQPHLG